jgi:hypothetical protein
VLVLYTLCLLVTAEVEGFHFLSVLYLVILVVTAEVGVSHLESSTSCDRCHALRVWLQPLEVSVASGRCAVHDGVASRHVELGLTW